MTDEDFLKQLREAFSIEADEHLQAITAGLLALEKEPPGTQKAEVVETIFRDAHSLKGAARAVSREDIESVCQALESVFSHWKQKDTPVAPETFDLLNRAIDLLARLLPLPEASTRGEERMEITGLVRELAAIAAPARTAPAPGPAPEAAPAPLHEPHAASETDAPQIAETVRIPMAKMDALLRHAEEMIAVKLTASGSAAELRALSGVIDGWRKEWAKVRDHARGDLAAQSPAALAKLASFLDWNQGYMRSVEKRVTALASAAEQEERNTAGLIDTLLDDAKRLVMLPFATLFDIFPKIVRDLARTQGKEVALHQHGREVEIDKRILQEMKDPLIHLVRNAIDHGIETPAERTSARRPASGTVTLSVSQLDGSKVEILVADDGAGIDVKSVKSSAVHSGALTAEEARTLGAEAALALIFDSGVSTSPIITEVSGRGLGMAIVREKVEKLGGQITIETATGIGTTFRIVLPITLATFKGILVSTGGQTFAIPTAKIEKIKRCRRDEIRTVENRETFLFDGHAVALARLDEVLGLPRSPDVGAFLEVVVLGTGDRRIGFAVDGVLSEQEVLVKIIGKPLLRVRNVAGATILGSGVPTVILNTADLLKSAVRSAAGPRPARPAEAAVLPREILVADDSVTSRMLLKNILESAGYRVTTATDGLDALTSLRGRDFDLLVSDVEMPRLDGFDLTTKVRADKRLRELPVILVTALGSREHRERGVDVGASAYIVKSSFDQSNLLDIVRKLL